MRLLTLCLLALVTHSYAYSPDDFIHSLGATYFGFWGQTEACENGSYARSFEVKVQDEQLFDDNTAVNAIALLCYTPDGYYTGAVTSSIMDEGSYHGIYSCDEGDFLGGYDLKVQEEQLLDDNTAVNVIALYCYTPNGDLTGVVTSSTMNEGHWTGMYSCDEGDFLGGYDLKSQPEQGALGDNTAANALRMYCKSQGEDVYLESPGTKWGDWLGPSFCRENMAVCGLMTLVEESQGAFGDDTALNDVRFLCCDLPEQS